MKNKYIAHNLHSINKPEMIEKVSFTVSYLKIYQYTAADNNLGMPGKSGTPAESPLRYGDKTLVNCGSLC